jgi:hypothetical protein
MSSILSLLAKNLTSGVKRKVKRKEKRKRKSHLWGTPDKKG